MMLWRHLRPLSFISRAEREYPSYVSRFVMGMTSCRWLAIPLLFWRCPQKEHLVSDPDSSFHMTNLGGLTSAIVILIVLLDHFLKAHYSLIPEMKTTLGDKVREEGAANQRCSFSYGGHSACSYFSFCFACNFVI